MSGPHWGAGFIGPDGTDYVAEQADEIRRKMGRGLYSQDPHGDMGQWRDLFAIPLALLRNFCEWMVRNANPGKATDLLSYWEGVLGMPRPPSSWGIAERQQRCKERLRRWPTYPGGPTTRPAWAGFPSEFFLWAVFYSIHFSALGIAPVSFTQDAPGVAAFTLTVSPDMYDPGNAYWLAELTFWRDALCPAWGQITITA